MTQKDFSLLLPVIFSISLVAIAPRLGLTAHIIIFAFLAVMLVSGRLLGRVLRLALDPFMDLVVGFVLLAHALLAVALVFPGVDWPVAVALGCGGLLGWRQNREARPAVVAGLGLFAAAFTFTWCADIGPRLRHFYDTGQFLFWNDFFFHSATLARFGAPEAIGRGMALMADSPAPFYHYASYLPPAVVARLAGVPPLDTALLIWLPLGILVMACGVISLGRALRGPRLAVAGLAALAFLPDPARFPLGNGMFDFAWLLETHPGTPYSLGISCAAIACLVRWHREQSLGLLLAAGILTAGCFLVRANTFVWLAPTVVLSAAACFRRVPATVRVGAVALGAVCLMAFLALISWRMLREWPASYLVTYNEYIHGSQGPMAYEGLYPALVGRFGRIAASVFGLGLTLLATLGPWLPAFLLLGALAMRRRYLDASDWIPVLLACVSMLAIVAAPAPNGDGSEFRHRPAPLLVVVFAIWTVRFAALVFIPAASNLSRRWAVALTGIAAVSLLVQLQTIGEAKRPRMRWAVDYYGTRIPVELFRIAPSLRKDPAAAPRFAVSSRPPDGASEDDASYLTALSGVPAYLSYTRFLAGPGNSEREQVRRVRMTVLDQLKQASSLPELLAVMRSARITDYVVTSPEVAAFDPKRRDAVATAGPFAVYRALPAQ